MLQPVCCKSIDCVTRVNFKETKQPSKKKKINFPCKFESHLETEARNVPRLVDGTAAPVRPGPPALKLGYRSVAAATAK